MIEPAGSEDWLGLADSFFSYRPPDVDDERVTATRTSEHLGGEA